MTETRRKMKKFFAILLVAVILVGLVACAAPAPAEPEKPAEEPAAETAEEPAEEPVVEEPAAEPIVIGCDYATSDKYNLQVLNKVQEICDEKGYTLVKAEGQRDAEKTLANIDSFLLKGAKYVLVIGVDETMLTPIQDKCEAKGAKVAFTSVGAPEGFTTVNAEGGSNYEVSQVMSKILADAAKERWNGEVDLAVVTYNSGQGKDGQDICDVFTEVWGKELGVKPEDIVFIDCGWDNMKASELYTSMFTAHPDAQHILAYGFVDVHHGVPLYNAAKAAGKLENMIMASTNQADDATPVCMKESPDTWVAQMPKGGAGPAQVFMDIVIDEIENGVEIEKIVYNPTGDPTIATAETIDQYFL